MHSKLIHYTELQTKLVFGTLHIDNGATVLGPSSLLYRYWRDVNDHNKTLPPASWAVLTTLRFSDYLVRCASVESDSFAVEIEWSFLDTDGSVLHSFTENIAMAISIPSNQSLSTVFERQVNGNAYYQGSFAGLQIDMSWTPGNDSDPLNLRSTTLSRPDITWPHYCEVMGV